MSVYIKGADKPLGCGKCFYDAQCDIWKIQNWGMPPPKNCPIIQVPAHGDLIDRDEQIERTWRLNLSTRELIEEMLKSATTIIPADRRDGE